MIYFNNILVFLKNENQYKDYIKNLEIVTLRRISIIGSAGEMLGSMKH